MFELNPHANIKVPSQGQYNDHFDSLEITRINAPFSSLSRLLSARSWSTVWN